MYNILNKYIKFFGKLPENKKALANFILFFK